MFNITEDISSWPSDVRGYQTNTPVIGGDNTTPGDSNLPLQDVANRTGYLYDRVGRFEDVVVITGNATITAASKYKLNYISIASGNAIITIDDVANFQTGAILAFKCNCPDKKMITFQTTSSQLIDDGIVAVSKKYAAKGEEFKLVAAGDHWLMIDAKGNWDKVGQEDLLRFQPTNSIIANGCTPEISGVLLSRTDLPRLWEKVSPVAIDDATWLSNIAYRGYWSRGNGSTSFRSPDYRAMVFRGLDLGRGIRVGQLDNTPGSYEADGLLSHNHVSGNWNRAGAKASEVGGVQTPGATDNANAPFEYRVGGMDTTLWEDARIKAVGNAENTVKNAGLLPIIYY